MPLKGTARPHIRRRGWASPNLANAVLPKGGSSQGSIHADPAFHAPRHGVLRQKR
jgi:hypothetical protein